MLRTLPALPHRSGRESLGGGASGAAGGAAGGAASGAEGWTDHKRSCVRLVLAILSATVAVRRVPSATAGEGPGPGDAGAISATLHVDKAGSLAHAFTPPAGLMESLVRLGCLHRHVDLETRVMVRGVDAVVGG